MAHAYTVPPKLPYETNALQPHISQETLQFHYGKHHMAYYNKMLAMTEGKDEHKGKSLIDLVRSTEGVLFNQAAQTYNHCFYWNSMKPNPEGQDTQPSGALAEAINKAFGSYEAFKEKFSAHAAGHFGSGWVWLILNKAGDVEIMETHDADCPLKGDRGIPLLACDVWEHAYYIDYRNARPDYVKAWWKLVNWEFAEENYKKAKN